MILFALLALINRIFAKLDGLAYEKPDKYDLKLGKNDMDITNYLDQKKDVQARSLEVEENNAKLDNQADTLNQYLGTNKMLPWTSRNLWKIIYDFIMKHIEDFLKDTKLSFKIHIRYAMCTFIVPLLPTEYFLIFPSFYERLIPMKFKRNEFVMMFLQAANSFLMKVRKRSAKELLPTFIFARKGSSLDDIKFMLTIPELITTDPMKLLRWVFEFELEDGRLGLADVAPLADAAPLGGVAPLGDAAPFAAFPQNP